MRCPLDNVIPKGLLQYTIDMKQIAIVLIKKELQNILPAVKDFDLAHLE